MSFTSTDKSSPNYLSCFFIIDKLVETKNNFSQQLGNVIGSYDLSYIQDIFDANGILNPFNTSLSSSPPLFSIITNYPNGPATKFILGMPNKNNNNLSKKDITKAMNFYNINLLRSIVPYIKTKGNDTTIPINVDNCISAKERKILVTKYKNFGNVSELNTKEITSIVNKLGLFNRVCLKNTNYI